MSFPIKEFIVLAKALPKALIKEPTGEVSFIIDAKGNMIGEINWREGVISIYENYKYAAQVREALGEDRFENAKKDFPIPEAPIRPNDDKPGLTDYGEILYGKNKT